MKKINLIIIILFCTLFNLKGQKLSNIEMRYVEPQSKFNITLDRFYLNHAIYSNCFLKGAIYDHVSIEELAYISNEVYEAVKLSLGVQFFIKLNQQIPYRFTVSVIKHGKNNTRGLGFLTNFNPNTKLFEKESKSYLYASGCKISDNKVIGGVFTLDNSNEEKYLNNNNYLSLLQLYIFNGTCSDNEKMNELFENAESKEEDIINCHWLKGFYNLYLRNFTQAEKELESLKKLAKTLPHEKQNAWKFSISVLEKEIKLLKITDSKPTMHNKS